jgi:DNA-binding transcriptional LysR family regulator
LRLYAARRMLRGRRLRISDPASARGVTLVTFAPELHMLQEAAWFQPVLASTPVTLSTNSTHTLLAAARAGLGVAVLPDFVARRHSDLVAVSEPVASHALWLVLHPDFRRDPRVRAVADFVKGAIWSDGEAG